MKINFTKMHGIGNDYVYIDGFQYTLSHPNRFSEFISDRHFGIGSDGLVLILPSEVADFKMRMFNADGSEGKMCGNASRCIGKWVYESGYTTHTTISLETLSGIKELILTVEDNQVIEVEVNMGKAILLPSAIPVLSEKGIFINEEFQVDGSLYAVTCVSMGNPHAVIFYPDIDILTLEKLGPLFEHHPLFPERINTEFVEIVDEHTFKMRVWERGSGETFACGTGACATVVAAVLNGYCKKDTWVTVQLRGGQLHINYQSDGTVCMKGSATTVFTGSIDYKED